MDDNLFQADGGTLLWQLGGGLDNSLGSNTVIVEAMLAVGAVLIGVKLVQLAIRKVRGSIA